jgi:hypothetical protein
MDGKFSTYGENEKYRTLIGYMPLRDPGIGGSILSLEK